MNRLGNTLILCVPAILAIIQAPVHSRERQSIDDGWKFIHSDSLQAENPGFDDSQWRTVDLPHDWSIEYPVDKEAPTGGSGGYAETGVGWYRKVISFDENPEGKTVWLEFDGIYMNSDVWMNGHHLGNHPCGYTSFYYDVSEFLKKGKNVIAVKVDNSRQPNSRWYSGSGPACLADCSRTGAYQSLGYGNHIIRRFFIQGCSCYDPDNGRKQFPEFTTIYSGHNDP
jgi:hypothetical protein